MTTSTPLFSAVNDVSPAIDLVAVTPHDTQDLVNVARVLFVGQGGNVAVRTTRGATVTFRNVPSGAHIGPFNVSRVLATGTTAQHLVAYL